MRNAKDEFLSVTKGYKIIAASVTIQIGYKHEGEYFSGEFKLKPLYSDKDYDDFINFLDKEYDAGYGGQQLFGVIYCEDGYWMQRGEYDGSEWWDIFKYPDLRESFIESDVVKYERSIKLQNIRNNT